MSNRVETLSNRLEVVTNTVEALASNVEIRIRACGNSHQHRRNVVTGQFLALTETVQQSLGEQRAFNERVVQAIGELRIANEELMASHAELRISNEETKIANANIVRRMDRMEQDSRFLKNFSTEVDARRYVESVAEGMDLTYVRTLTTRELMDMAEGHLSGSLRRSFVRADLVMEVIDDGQPCYAAVEVSYTVDAIYTSCAIRDAGYITR